MEFRDVFSAVCISLSLVCTLPQAYRVLVHNTVEGVSPPTQLQGFAGSILWIVYGLHSGTYLVVLANMMTIVGVGIVIVQMVRHKTIGSTRVATVEVGVLALSLLLLMLSPTMLAFVAVVVGSTGILPQVIRAARTQHLTGVSVATYAIIAVMSMSWFAYGIMIDDYFVAAPNFIIVPSAAFIAFRAVRSHQLHSKTSVASALPAR